MDLRQAFDPLRALGVALRALRRAPVTLLLGGLLLVLTDADDWIALEVDREGFGLEDVLALAWVSIGACVTVLVLFPLNCLLRIGYAGALQRVMVTGDERFKDLFQERGLWLSMVLARAMKWVLLWLTALPFYVLVGAPAFVGDRLGMEEVGWVVGVLCGVAYLPVWAYVWLGFLVVEEAVAIEGKRPVEAVQRSWRLAEGNRVQLLVFAVVTGLLQMAWLLLCCLGALLYWLLVPLAAIWSHAAWTEAYLRLALPAPREGMWIDHTR